MQTADYIIVGSGITGATIARQLADQNREVFVIDRRNSVGGNVHDSVHFSNIRIHTYGPHYFRTNSERIWNFVTRFGRFYKFEATLLTYVDNSFQHWPIQQSYIDRMVGRQWKPDFCGTPVNFEEAALSLMPAVVYKKFIKGYTEKQWGVLATELSATLVKRFDVRTDDDTRLVRHKYQGLPELGYSNWMISMLEGIPVQLNTDYLLHQHEFRANKCLIFTGPIDEFYSFIDGKLMYRSQKRIHKYYPNDEYLLPAVQVNNPDPLCGQHVRTLEWKHLMRPSEVHIAKGTVLTEEIPFTPDNPDEYEYPFPDNKNQDLYESYRRKAVTNRSLLICGRLGEYRYYDMDQAIGRALRLADTLIQKT